ncbi:MAG: CRISPR-associated helicase Cas3' [Planctomycetia bacterium]|nr:CRISPR-associated helicase Cas3' [Planctomycetia bacterium]
MTHLYAKSFGPEATDIQKNNARLFSHLANTCHAARCIIEETGKSQLESLGVAESLYEPFCRICCLAAAIHDLGKANSLFQNAVQNNAKRIPIPQSIRHEWILFILLRSSPFENWIRSALKSDDEYTILVWAVTGHHRKKLENATNERGLDMTLLFDSDDFRDCLNWIKDEFHLPEVPDLKDAEMTKIYRGLSLPGRTIQEGILQDRICPENKLIRRWKFSHHGVHTLLPAVRSTLMAADVAASALADPDSPLDGAPLTKEGICHWIHDSLGTTAARKEYYKVVEHRQREIAAKAVPELKNGKLNRERDSFQNAVANSQNRVTLVVAGCGSGKTLAAFRWAEQHVPEGGKRLFFGYPTTGTATEGFLDYLLDDNNHQLGDLIHSRIAVDFLLNEQMRNIASDSDDNDSDNRMAMVNSLRLWGTRLVCCTVDTILGFLVNAYSGHLAWPALSQSLFVFDEIHSYDDTLFNNLLKFLRIVRGAPVLLMTASLPKERLLQLRDVVEETEDESLNVVEGPKEWERIKRYQRLASDNSPEEEVIARYNRGEKILWVCNTVNRAIKAAKAIQALCQDAQLIVYHSHFRYEDRVNRHNECIAAFKKDSPAICVTTQVAEMSLDISADFLLMDLAPIPAMIQRLGRLNRRAISDGALPFMVIFPQNENGEPYLWPYVISDRQSSKGNQEPYPNWHENAQRWLDALGEEPLSQADLTHAWEKTAAEVDTMSENGMALVPPWVSPGPDMSHSNLRDSNSGCDVILKEDFAAVRHGGKVEYLRCVIPMPMPSGSEIVLVKDPKFGCYIVTRGEDIDYDQNFGASWKNRENRKDKSPDGVNGFEIV